MESTHEISVSDTPLRQFQENPAFTKPLAERPPNSAFFVQFSTTTNLISDAFIYHLALHRETDQVYVVRAGGIAGLWEFFGPVARLAEDPSCRIGPSLSDRTTEAETD